MPRHQHSVTFIVFLALITALSASRAEARDDWDVDEQRSSFYAWEIEEREDRAIRAQHRNAGLVLKIGLPVGLITATIGGIFYMSSICFMGCDNDRDDHRRANMEIGTGLAIAGGVLALGSLVIGGGMLENANRKLRKLRRLVVSVAPAPDGFFGGARWVF